jgi:hypothetical protein
MKPSDSKEARRERVKLHRLRERLRPKEPPSADSDPWEDANEALILMNAVKAGLRNPNLVAKQEEAMELLRRVAWGPESD